MSRLSFKLDRLDKLLDLGFLCLFLACASTDWLRALPLAFFPLLLAAARAYLPPSRLLGAGFAGAAVLAAAVALNGSPRMWALAGTMSILGVIGVLEPSTDRRLGVRIGVPAIVFVISALSCVTAFVRPGWPQLLGLGALTLAAGVSCTEFWWAASHRHPPLGQSGLAGLVLVAGCLPPVVTELPLGGGPATTLYALITALLVALVGRHEGSYRASQLPRLKRLTVTVIVKDEADRIGRCLQAVHGWADEIIVLDSGSRDGTVEIARRYTDKVFETDWPGYGAQKQRALELASGDWVLAIDADEELSPELRQDIDAALDREPVCVGYGLPWGWVVYGKVLDFGRSARAPLRLFRRAGASFTTTLVHERVLTAPGRIGRLRGRLYHHTHRDFGHALSKSAQYAWLGARQRHLAGRRGFGLTGAFARALIVFLQVYFIRLGVLDGRPGLVVALLYSQTTFNKYVGLWTLRRAQGRHT
jgi:(heptosyl)LPS beta-1,4-glucosyltransferase